MRASEVLQKCLSNSLSGMHALRQRALLRAVEALLHGGRLTLIDLARAWPGATRVRATYAVRMAVVSEALRRCRVVQVLVARSTGSGIHVLPKRGYLAKVPARVSFTKRVLQLQVRCAARGAAGWSLCRCYGDDQLAVAHAYVEFAADGEAELFQPAAA
ncbi:hypothetical protein XarbCFBP7408_13540 [Xanthomonas arboricola pv. guizotiae]|uniref:Uncharacterized protein n=1 Tax=Xanthomonas arboricola pv. guizotiae TaxID=487867 RepID=A0A2S7A6E4_9XANT|nr:hypothetical protein XarbCFBP7409_02710 [Xanthomonas arboricola pv. guizotiae]PPU22810.1 hypothetical protein XarbCFBP7408_13540 [Xanthomonas arboricola pv. guizotiae]